MTIEELEKEARKIFDGYMFAIPTQGDQDLIVELAKRFAASQVERVPVASDIVGMEIYKKKQSILKELEV